MEPTTANVLAVYSNASAHALREGLSWYKDAHDFARMIDSNVVRSSGVIAALSPLNAWETNKKAVAKAYSQGTAAGTTLIRNEVKADRILCGEHPLDVLSGNKVRAFFSTILDPMGYDDPVIDRHAFDIAVGEITNDKIRGMLSRKGVYHEFAKCYVDAARIANISASQMQAVTWIAWREWKGIVD